MKVNDTYTAVVKQSGKWWIGWIAEIPGVNCQESTREELLESLRVTLAEALEFNRREAKEAAGGDTPGGPIPHKNGVQQFRGITKSMTILPAKSVKISEFPL